MGAHVVASRQRVVGGRAEHIGASGGRGLLGAADRELGPCTDPGGTVDGGFVRQRRDYPQPELGVDLLGRVDAPMHDRTKVVEVDPKALAPCELVGTPDARRELLSYGGIVLSVASTPAVGYAALVEALGRVLPDRLEELVAHHPVRSRLGHDHRLGHKAGERVEDVPALDAVAGGDRFRGARVEGPREHCKPVEDRPLVRIEQRV